MKQFLSVILGSLLFASVSVSGAKPVTIKLWFEGAPTKTGLEGAEEKSFLPLTIKLWIH